MLRRLASVATEGMVNRVVVSGDRLLGGHCGRIGGVRRPHPSARCGWEPRPCRAASPILPFPARWPPSLRGSRPHVRCFGPGARSPQAPWTMRAGRDFCRATLRMGSTQAPGLQIYRLRVGLRQTLDWHGFPTNVLPVHVPLPITIHLQQRPAGGHPGVGIAGDAGFGNRHGDRLWNGGGGGRQCRQRYPRPSSSGAVSMFPRNVLPVGKPPDGQLRQQGPGGGFPWRMWRTAWRAPDHGCPTTRRFPSVWGD